MPHVIVEYSANIEAEITPQRLVEEIHGAAIASGIAEPVAVRTRLKRREHFRVGDGSPENAFVHIDIRGPQGPHPGAEEARRADDLRSGQQDARRRVSRRGRSR